MAELEFISDIVNIVMFYQNITEHQHRPGYHMTSLYDLKRWCTERSVTRDRARCPCLVGQKYCRDSKGVVL